MILLLCFKIETITCCRNKKNSTFNFLKNHQNIFCSGFTILHSHQQSTRVLISPHLCQNLFFISSYFAFSKNSLSLQQYLIVILICIPLMTSALQADFLPDFLPARLPPGKAKNTGVGSLSLFQQIFLTQELNWGLLHCQQILYQLSYQGSPMTNETEIFSCAYQSFECLLQGNVYSSPLIIF